MNYKIIDNFLLKKHFDYLSNLNLKKVEPNSINIYHNKIYKNGAVYSECIPKDYLIEMDKTYQNILINFLQYLNLPFQYLLYFQHKLNLKNLEK